MNSLPTIPLFSAGQIVATPGALALLEQTHKSPLEFLSRHLRGDWGDLCQEDKTENELSLKYGFRLMSSYAVTNTEKLWIITEADRSVTTLLLPKALPESTVCRNYSPRISRHRPVYSNPIVDHLSRIRRQ